MKRLTSLRHIWLCDDDADDHFVFTEALKQIAADAVLSTFCNGSEVLLQLQQQKPDILFLDINMPVINGIETLKKIRDTGGNDFPIVMYSVSEQLVDIDTAYRCGAILYVIKPQLYQDLVKLLNLLFELDWCDTNQLSSLQHDGEKCAPLKIVG